jgi:hypothetical protein
MFRSREITLLERITDRATRELNNHPIGSEEYVRTLDVVIKLHKLREEETPKTVSKDTLLIVVANLLGIFMIIKHENVNVVTSKAMGLLLKPR